MGLDMTHYKAVMSPCDRDCKFRQDDIEADALARGFDQYIQTISDTDYPTRIMIANHEDSLEMAIERCGDCDELYGQFVGEPAGLFDEIKRIECQGDLDVSGRLIRMSTFWKSESQGTLGVQHSLCFDELKVNRWVLHESARHTFDRHPPAEGTAVMQYVTVSYPVPVEYPGFYAIEVGYQRGGMNGEFYSHFPDGVHLCWRLADVEKAAECSMCDEPGRDHASSFRDQFLNSFEEGRSLFSVWW